MLWASLRKTKNCFSYFGRVLLRFVQNVILLLFNICFWFNNLVFVCFSRFRGQQPRPFLDTFGFRTEHKQLTRISSWRRYADANISEGEFVWLFAIVVCFVFVCCVYFNSVRLVIWSATFVSFIFKNVVF